MTTRASGKTKRAEEDAAIRILKAVISDERAIAKRKPERSDRRSYDYDLMLSNGEKVAVEITSSDGGIMNLGSAHRRFYRTPCTKYAWTIELMPLVYFGGNLPTSQDIRILVDEIAPCLRKIENQYLIGVDSRLHESDHYPRLYNEAFECYVKTTSSCVLKIVHVEVPDSCSPAGVTVVISPRASLQVDNTEILVRRIQEAIDKKDKRAQAANWLVIHMRDYGGGSIQLRELIQGERNPPNGAEHLGTIKLKSFDIVVVYTEHAERYAALLLDKSVGWRIAPVELSDASYLTGA